MAKEVEYRIIGEQRAEDGTLIRIVTPVEPEKKEEPKKKGILARAAEKWDNMTGGQKVITILCGGALLYSGGQILKGAGLIGGGAPALTAGTDDINVDVSGYLD